MITISNLNFYKYEATGNDFILIDNRELTYSFLYEKPTLLAGLSHRQFGVGADGIIFLENSLPPNNFKMVYFNSDGKSATMCGNGTRAITHFAHYLLGIEGDKNKKEINYQFETSKGIYFSTIDLQTKQISIKMTELYDWGTKELTPLIKEILLKYNLQVIGIDYLNTGVPHLVIEISTLLELQNLSINSIASYLRYHPLFAPEGTNVNFIYRENCDKQNLNTFYIRTYERGVENETLSCGTGVVASSLYFHKKYKLPSPFKILSKGGELSVAIQLENQEYLLSGPVRYVFSGLLN